MEMQEEVITISILDTKVSEYLILTKIMVITMIQSTDPKDTLIETLEEIAVNQDID